MNQPAFKFEEFIDQPTETPATSQPEETQPTEALAETETSEGEVELENINVQKAVVESLAADKIEQNEKICELEKELADLKSRLTEVESKYEQAIGKLKSIESEFDKIGETLSANETSEGSNQIALLDRSIEIEDRFPGETRDHVLEVIKAARDQAEAEGRNRRAQILEAVLVSNEPSGQLETRRNELKRLFNENQNVINGTVIEKLNEMGISHKNGEDYLLTAEIIKRTY